MSHTGAMDTHHQELLVEFRKRKKWTQEKLAEELKIDRALVCKAEVSGQPLSVLAALALERVSEGELKAVDYVHETNREQLIVEISALNSKGAA